MGTASPQFLIAMVNYARTLGNEISLHSAQPGATGANEVAVERQETRWGPGRINADGTAECVGSPCSFTLDSGTTCTHFGVWNGDSFLFGAPIDPPVTIDEVGGGTVVLTPSYQEITS